MDKEAIKQKILDNVKHEPGPLDTPCWIWQNGLNRAGYGRTSVGKQDWLVHRLALNVFKDIDLGELYVCHTCDVPACCNPDHLFLGTASDNHKDAMRKNRHSFGVKNGNSKFSDVDIKRIEERYASGDSASCIAEYYGVAPSTIISILKGATWTHVIKAPVNTRLLGERRWNSVLTEDKVKEILTAYFKKGERICDICNRLGTPYNTTKHVIYRKTWKHVKI